MKVVIDDKIPYIRQAAELLFDNVVYLNGSSFSKSKEIIDADALIVRTRTLCNEELLHNTSVRFIATATIGFDHIDTAYLSQAGITWTNCPGCNASSVAQYVRNALFLVAQKRELEMTGFTVGIVGYGHVGKEVAKALEQAGCSVMLNDPPLQEAGTKDVAFCSLEEIAHKCNVITFHTPLTHGGTHPTYHLANSSFFSLLKFKPIIINAARGGVVDEKSLLDAFSKSYISDMIIDTWENEPVINPQLLNQAFIATPHIAGYSADGKSTATRMALRATCKFFGIGITEEERFLKLTAPPALPPEISISGRWVDDCLALYNPLNDSCRLKNCPREFEQQRGNYPLRREVF